jgi:outer membrane protein assembly factor BamB
MLPALSLSLLLLLSAPAFALSGADIAYPANPIVQPEALFAAGPGVARFDRATGGRVWSVLHEEQMGDPLMAGSLVVVGGGRTLFALDSGSGRLVWNYLSEEALFDPVLAHGRLILTSKSGTVRALSVESGTPLWERKIDRGWLYPPGVAGNLLITGGQDRIVFALDAATGAAKWQRSVDQELVYSPLVTAGGGVVITTFSGEVSMLNNDDGSELWRTRFDTPSLFPSMVGRLLLMAAFDGTLRALDPANGTVIWQQTLPSRLLAPVSGGAGLLLAAVDGGEIFILDSSTGAIVKRYRLNAEAIGAALLAENDSLVVFTGGRNMSGPVPVYMEGVENSD